MNVVKESLLINRRFADLNPLVYGHERCRPNHSFGPAVRNYTLIHYVVSGCGTYTTRGVTYTVHPGEAFRILPGETTVYTADAKDPWNYRWIGFDGALSERFRELPPVFSLSERAAEIFFFSPENDGMQEYRLASELFRFYAELFTHHRAEQSHYVRRVKDYVRAMYMQEVRVERIAEQMNLDRRYLSRVFKERTGETIQEYLISVRMEEAKRCLHQGCSVGETARLCGYEDVCNFSKMFKARTGISPAYFARTGTRDDR
jgi:AraC-like DNA-binding protein